MQLFINNEFVDSVSGKTFTTINPVNEKKIIDVSEADKVILLNIFKTTRKKLGYHFNSYETHLILNTLILENVMIHYI